MKQPRAFEQKYPALAAWRRRLARREHGEDPDRPHTWRYDIVWRCATWEASAAGAEAHGQLGLMKDCMAKARELMAEHVEKRRKKEAAR